MNESFDELLRLNSESVSVCESLVQTLQDERISLIALDTAKLSEVILMKEHLVHRLDQTRAKIFKLITDKFSSHTQEDFEVALSSEQKAQWREARTAWLEAWEKMAVLAHQNQMFLKHSVKNLGRLADHMKHLLGEAPRYSSKGDKVEGISEGKMLEASC